MKSTIYYKTFPLSKHDSSPTSTSTSTLTSIPVTPPLSSNNVSAKRNAVMETISLGRPAKLQKLEDEVKENEKTWICLPSLKAKQTGKKDSVQQIIQPIIDDIKPGSQRSDNKNPISLVSADSSFAHLPPCAKAMEAVIQAVINKPYTSSYTHACGSPEARRAIASHHSFPEHQLSPEHVIVTNGCSGALELSLTSLLDPGTALLVPQPGLPLYEEIADSIGAHVIRYRLDPNQGWECDMDHLEELVTSNKGTTSSNNDCSIKAMVITNPSTHGSVFSEYHLTQILHFALKHRLPIISDEVYGDLTFGSNCFHPMARVAAKHGRRVPIITTSGFSKQFLIPGWRIGWATFQNNICGSLSEVEKGAHRLSNLQHGVSHLQQSAIPTLLSPSTTPGLARWKENFRTVLERQATLLCSKLVNDCHCLDIRSPPQGSMYAIVHLDMDRLDETIQDDMDFSHNLVREENIFVLPGSSFGVPGTFRVAFSACERTLEIASQRIADFCGRHKREKGKHCNQ
eukprot:CAMPEP_0168191498 /NCGR_PEP_ID=MMETSP0139_2-20121125/17550_1 /TAXON_ID=44445 /ORGANISM="Pseudo-nitzschia australis, Strain 10249 10 AB" /LENGTH=513 /DNA_ID=CAMNT_0008114681 /DNA_START=217 /DNA_END=1758 /DNA_ORIENTATION=+